MSFDYTEIADEVLSILTEFGQDVTRRTYTTGTYDPAAGTVTPTTADTTRKGVLLDYAAGVTAVSGTLVQAGDKRLLLDAESTAAMTDHYVVGGVEYVVASLGEVSPAGTVVLYDLQLRRG